MKIYLPKFRGELSFPIVNQLYAELLAAVFAEYRVYGFNQCLPGRQRKYWLRDDRGTG